MICHLANSFLDALNQAVNAVTAASVGAGRLILASAQLAACRAQQDPRGPMNSWMPGMIPQNLQWAPDPCQSEQEQVDLLQEQASAGGNQVATQQLGAAPAPQLAEATDPVPNTDPAIPVTEFTTPPSEGAQNQWAPLLPEDILEMIIEAYEEEQHNAPDVEMLDEILEQMKMYHLWCPWGGPGTQNMKWKMKYKPPLSSWINTWAPS